MGLNNTDLSEFLTAEPLAGSVAAGQPVFATSGPGNRAVWANTAALSLLGAANLDDLTHSLRHGSDPAIRLLARLGSRIRPGGAAQLQKIRFRKSVTSGGLITMRCWAVAVPGKTGKPQNTADQDATDPADNHREVVFWVAALDAPAGLRRMPLENPDKTGEPTDLPGNQSKKDTPGTKDAAARLVGETLSNAAVVPSPVAVPSPEVQTLAPHALTLTLQAKSPQPRRGNVRFMWRSDGDGKLQTVDDALCEALGCDNGALTGESWDELIDSLPLEPSAPLRLSLARRDTWSRIEVLWPFTGSSRAAPVTLGGLPSFDRNGRFDGYSGFGVIHLDDAVERPVRIVNRNDGSGDKEGAAGSAEPELSGSQSGFAAVEPPASIGNVVSLRAWQSDNKPARDDGPLRPVAPGAIESAAPALKDDAGGQGNTDTGNTDTGKAGMGAANTEGPPGDQAAAFKPLHLNVPKADPDGSIQLSETERDAFREIARTLGARTREKDSVEKKDNAGKKHGLVEQDAAADPLRAADEIVSATRSPDSTAVSPPEFSAPKGQPADRDAPSSAAAGANLAGVAAAIAAAAVMAKNMAGKNTVVEQAETDKAPAGTNAAGADATSENGRSHTAVPVFEKPQSASVVPRTGPERTGPGSTGDELAAAAGASRSGIAGKQISDLVAEVRNTQKLLSGDDDAQSAPVKEHEFLRDRQAAALLDRIGPGVLALQDGAAVYVNQPLLDVLQYKSFEQFQATGGLHKMFRGRDPESLAREAAGGAIPVVTRTGDILAMDGKSHAASWNGKPASLLTLQPSQMLEREAKLRGLELDIRKRESEIRELHSILDTATDGVALLDDEGRILSLNGSGQALFGYDQNEVVGDTLTVLLARESHAQVMDYFNGLKSNGVRNVLNDGREVQGRASKGGLIPLFMTIGCINAGPEQRFCAVLRDVTQWKKAERELNESRHEAERTSSLKSEFLAKISHEVRTPLNAILGFAEVIMDERFGPVENERYKDYLKDIHASGTHVLSLINDLLDLSKIEAGKLELDFGSVDVSKVVNECVSIMQSHALRERVIMRLSLAPRLPNIVADERSLRQIVLNILSNAVKFNEAGGQVIVSTALTDSGSAVIRVRDTGIGMSEKDIELALEPFRQIATSRRSGGTGLGLPLTKALVEANRAAFSIKSKKDEGTLVEITFPQTRVLAE